MNADAASAGHARAAEEAIRAEQAAKDAARRVREEAMAATRQCREGVDQDMEKWKAERKCHYQSAFQESAQEQL